MGTIWREGRKKDCFLFFIDNHQKVVSYFLMDIYFLYLELHPSNTKLTKFSSIVQLKKKPTTIKIIPNKKAQGRTKESFPSLSLMLLFDWIEEKKKTTLNKKLFKPQNEQWSNTSSAKSYHTILCRFYWIYFIFNGKYRHCRHHWNITFKCDLNQFLHENNISFDIVVGTLWTNENNNHKRK